MEKGRTGYFELIIAGRGGQGALTIGRLLADAGMSEYRHVTYFPNYGAAMRGGESECTVILSDQEITGLAMLEPAAVILMGAVPLEEFVRRIKPGGLLIFDGSLAAQKVNRENLKVIDLPATRIAAELGDSRAANFVFLGAYLAATGAVLLEICEEVLEKKLGGGKNEILLSIDKQALREGAKLAGVA